jgi:hypothetical protein
MSLFSCRDTARLTSASLDGPLPLRRRLALRAHLWLCRGCARYYRHLRFLHDAAPRLAAQAARGKLGPAGLSPEARARIKRALRRP